MLANLYHLFFFHQYPRPEANQSQQFSKLSLEIQQTSEYLLEYNNQIYERMTKDN